MRFSPGCGCCGGVVGSCCISAGVEVCFDGFTDSLLTDLNGTCHALTYHSTYDPGGGTVDDWRKDLGDGRTIQLICCTANGLMNVGVSGSSGGLPSGFWAVSTEDLNSTCASGSASDSCAPLSWSRAGFNTLLTSQTKPPAQPDATADVTGP